MFLCMNSCLMSASWKKERISVRTKNFLWNLLRMKEHPVQNIRNFMEETSSGLAPSEMPEERSSGSDEEGPENCSTREQTFQCDSNGNMDEPFTAIKPNMSAGYRAGDDLREFTEEDQEQIEESLADYPSDLSQSETEECAESARDQLSTLLDSSLGLSNDQLNKTKDLSHAEEDNLQEEDKPMDFTSTDSDSEIKEPEVQTISEAADVDASFQSENADEDDVEESLTNDSSTEEDTRNQGMGDERDASNGNNQDQPDYDSDISSDHSTSQEENPGGYVRHEEELKCNIQQNDYIEDLGRADLDIDYIGIDTEDKDGSNPEMDSDFTNASSFSYTEYCNKEPNEEPTELHPTLQSVQLDPTIKEQDVPLAEVLNSVRDTNTLISEVFWSSELLMSENELLLDEYDWDLTGQQQLEVNVGEEENQEDAEEALEELDSDDDGEEKARDWEQEKTRIEAFYRYYDQDEPEEKADRNHKVTFCLDHESSEYEEESESSEEELDKDPDIPPTTIKPEYHSESDDELQEKHFIPEKPKLQPREQQPVSPTQNASPPRNKCLAVLKSVLALGLVTAMGMVSFWWATDNLEWIR
ncbi:glutamic acid-rich protein [Colossoma macropomum]|uniref:glutamic acid-rich protein n=1 Tax=Colossoma macropomum TaxID=42526 RepID=UPI001863CC3E|nr:glutamic acid-rich protein [Colossoma macropomum]XP_036435183.1 glutamic acid-rich protein [Colossoma macropomum]XP_036435184.1 glutamic acid-rich protein [Colossoma macropomum]